MKTKRWCSAALVVGMLAVTGSLAAANDPSPAPSAYRVLLVDGTKTLNSTMRVVALAGGIRQSGAAELTVIFADGLGPFDIPLREEPLPAVPFDLIIIVPRGIDDGTASRIWLLVAGNPQADPAAAQAIERLAQGIARAFAGLGEAVGPLDDLWAALTASVFVREGWLQ